MGHMGFLRLSQAVSKTLRPPITEAYSWAAQYVPTPGRPLLDMSQGSPNISPPKFVLDSLAAASAVPLNCRYLPVIGDPALRLALANEMKEVYGKGTDVSAEDIILTAGCNMAYVATIMALADRGDEVILPCPWYFNHQMTHDMLGLTTVALHTRPENGFWPDPELCESLITERTKAIALVTPNNPTGAIYSSSLIASFALLAKRYNIALIIDETYRDFIIGGPPHDLFAETWAQQQSLSSQNWSWREQFVHLFSFSKSYCIPGHRLGAIVAPAELRDNIKTVLDCLQICAQRPVQAALHHLLPKLRGFVKDTAHSLAHRHTLLKTLLPQTWRIGSQGTYYAFVRHPFKGVSALDVCKRLAVERGLVTLPSNFFIPQGKITGEDDRWVRLSVMNVTDETLAEACKRLLECEKSFGWEVER